MRGFGGSARRGQLKDYIVQENLDIVGVQETIKQDFSDSDMLEIAGKSAFQWCWLPAKGRSGGILMGVKVDLLEVEDVNIREFCITLNIRNRLTNFRFSVTTVYGPAHHELLGDFLKELDEVCDKESLPMIIGSDFNLIREPQDRNSGPGDINLMDMFNKFIGCHQLRELDRTGPRFTWSNNQDCPVMAKLDRILATTEWESRFPTCIVGA